MTLEEFEAQFNPEIIEIAAVTGFRKPASIHLRGDTHAFASIRLVAWQDLASGEVHEEDVILCDMVEKAKDFTKHFKKESTVKLMVQVGKDTEDKRFRFIKKTGSRFANFPELKEILARQKKPFCIDDESLGRLTLDRSFNQLEGEIPWCGNTIELRLGYKGKKADQSSVALAREFFDKQTDWDKRVREYAAWDFTEVANDSWLDEGCEIDKEEFARRISILSILINDDGGFTFLCDDDDIFAGHSIVITGDKIDGFNRVDLFG